MDDFISSNNTADDPDLKSFINCIDNFLFSAVIFYNEIADRLICVDREMSTESNDARISLSSYKLKRVVSSILKLIRLVLIRNSVRDKNNKF